MGRLSAISRITPCPDKTWIYWVYVGILGHLPIKTIGKSSSRPRLAPPGRAPSRPWDPHTTWSESHGAPQPWLLSSGGARRQWNPNSDAPRGCPGEKRASWLGDFGLVDAFCGESSHGKNKKRFGLRLFCWLTLRNRNPSPTKMGRKGHD